MRTLPLLHPIIIILATLSCLTSCGGGACCAGGGGGVDQFHGFPWPPPEPTSQREVPRSLPTESGSKTTRLSDVDRRLRSALDSEKYQKSYWGAPDGFVI